MAELSLFSWVLVVLRYALKICLLLNIAWLGTSGLALAQSLQEDSPSVEAEEELPSTTPAASAEQSLWQKPESNVSAAPDIFLVPDATGKLRQILGFRYEELLELWQFRENRNQLRPPNFVIDDIAVSGTVDGEQARLRIEMNFELTTKQWVQIPLLLPELLIERLEIEEKQVGECVVFDETLQSHTLWLAGRDGSKRSLVLEGIARISTSEGEKSIEVHLPRATSSRLTLRVPGDNAQFESTSELPLNVEQDDRQAVVSLRSLGTPLRLSWRSATNDASDPRSLFEVDGETLVQLDRHQVRYQASLRIRSAQQPLRRVRIRLPQGAKLEAQESTPSYELVPLDQQVESMGQAGRKLLEVRFKNPLQGEWNLRLSAQRGITSFGESTECLVEGFETLGALRQTGTVVLEIDDRLQAYFNLMGDIEQTLIESNVRSVPNHSVLAALRYTRFPWQIVAITSPRQRRNIVKPEYDLTIHTEDSELDLSYAYQLSGAQTFSLRIDLRGWTLRDGPIESGGLIDEDRVVITRDGQLILPLVDPDAQQVRINLRLRRPSDLGRVELPLPEPLGCFVPEGELHVSGSESLSVVPQSRELIGLSVASLPSESAGGFAANTVEPRAEVGFFQTFLSRPTFVAEVARRERQIAVSQSTQVTILESTVHVEQSLAYECKFRPVSQLRLNVPGSLTVNESLQFRLEGEELSYVRAPANQDDPSFSGVSTTSSENVASELWLLKLPRAMLGSIPIEVIYDEPLSTESDQQQLSLLVSLIEPEDSLSEHVLFVNARSDLSVSYNPVTNPPPWTAVSTEVGSIATSQTLQLQSQRKLNQLQIGLDSRVSDSAELATLEQGWIQSWVAGSIRQTRVVFRFRTVHSTVSCRLPSGWSPAEIELLLDGTPQHFKLSAEGKITVLLPTDLSNSSHVLELRYQETAPLPTWGDLKTDCPQLECHPTKAPIYWQLILPRSWQVASSSPGLASHYWLGWKNYRWGRQPTFTQSDLEQITGAATALEPPPMASQYVFRSFSLPQTLQVRVIRRIYVLLAIGLVSFGIGLVWLYTNFFRYGSVWLGLALVLLVGTFVDPESSMLFLQAIFAGGLMAVLGGVLRRIFVTQPPSDPPPTQYSIEPITHLTGASRPQSELREGNAETTISLPTSGPVS